MHCPLCGHTRTEVYNSRNTAQHRRIWRRRRCLSCQAAFTTYEASDLSFITIQKRSGATQPYIRTKLLISIYQATVGLDDQMELIESLVDTIEDRLLGYSQSTIPTSYIAATCGDVLQHFSTSAYVRYLSYRGDLESASQLKAAIETMS